MLDFILLIDLLTSWKFWLTIVVIFLILAALGKSEENKN